MIEYKYGTYGDEQFLDSTTYIRKQIFYLLLYVDPKTNSIELKYDRSIDNATFD